MCCHPTIDAQALSSCRRSGDDQPALQFTDSEYTEVFISFCQRKQLQFAHVQMIKDYTGNMSDKHPGLVLHMLDVLDVVTNYADSEAEYVARAQDIYLGQTFISSLENVLSPASALALLKQVTQDLRPFALQSQENRSFYGRLCLL